MILSVLPQPGGTYVPAGTVGPIVWLAGVVSTQGGEVITGTAGAGRKNDEGYAETCACAPVQLAVLTP